MSYMPLPLPLFKTALRHLFLFFSLKWILRGYALSLFQMPFLFLFFKTQQGNIGFGKTKRRKGEMELGKESACVVLTIVGIMKKFKGVYKEDKRRDSQVSKWRKYQKGRYPKREKQRTGSGRNGEENQKGKERKRRETQVWKPKKYQKGWYP